MTVEFPWLLPLTRWLLKLPPTFGPLLWLAHKLWKGYTIRKRIHRVKWTWRECLAMVRQFVRLE